MARTRTIRPSFWTSFTLGRVSRDARLLFIGLWSEADDEGRLIDSPKALAGALFPHDEDVGAELVERWLAELIEVDAIRRYEVAGASYLYIPKWDPHQKPPHRTPSRIPKPPGQRVRNSRKSSAPLANSQEKGRTGLGVSGLGVSVSGSGSGGDSRKALRATPPPDDFELSDDLRAWADREAPGVNPDHETKLFLDHHRAKGTTFKDWPAAWRTWMRRAVEYQRSNGSNGSKKGRADDELRAFAARENAR